MVDNNFSGLWVIRINNPVYVSSRVFNNAFDADSFILSISSIITMLLSDSNGFFPRNSIISLIWFSLICGGDFVLILSNFAFVWEILWPWTI